MKIKRSFEIILTIVIGGFLLTSCTRPNETTNENVRIDGSSTVYPITEAVAEEFQKKESKKVTVSISGTGGGFKKFCRGETDIQDASRPILDSEMNDCRANKVTYYEFPIGYDAIVVAVNSQNKWLNEITAADLKKIWSEDAQGKVMKWSDVNPKWPNEPVHLFGPGSDSGTFDYFTEAINGKAKSSRGDYTANAKHNVVVSGISKDVNALGFIGYAYYAENQNDIKALKVVGGPNSPKKDEAITPSRATVEDGTYYPLSRPIFIYANESDLAKPDVKKFLDFYLDNALTLVEQVKYVPLPSSAYDGDKEHLAQKKLGTAFGGKNEVGLKIEELLKRETKL